MKVVLICEDCHADNQTFVGHRAYLCNNPKPMEKCLVFVKGTRVMLTDRLPYKIHNTVCELFTTTAFALRVYFLKMYIYFYRGEVKHFVREQVQNNVTQANNWNFNTLQIKELINDICNKKFKAIYPLKPERLF